MNSATHSSQPLGLVIYLVVGALLISGGIHLDRADSLTPAYIALWIHAAGLIGALTFAITGPRDARFGRSIATYVGWRVSFFPVLVLSGHIASIIEWGLWRLDLSRWIYPTILLGMVTGVSVAIRITFAALNADSKRRRVACLLALVPAGLITFTGPGDLDPLPDRTPFANLSIPVAQPPTQNVYQRAQENDGTRLTQRPLLFAASRTYATIPDSPWASQVQGTLEFAFSKTPRASSTDRVAEHFQAFSAAHESLIR